MTSEQILYLMYKRGQKSMDNKMKFSERLKGHLATINAHKAEVMKNCFRAGLYRQGLMHDMSKYSPVEFFKGVKYFQGDKSPNVAERMESGVSLAWLHHKGRNKHHFEYWTDYDVNNPEGMMCGMKMPLKYLVEMVCDRIAASKTYMKDKYTDRSPLDYFNKGKNHYLMHPATMRQLEMLLTLLAKEGEEKLFSYMRHLLREDRRKKHGKL